MFSVDPSGVDHDPSRSLSQLHAHWCRYLSCHRSSQKPEILVSFLSLFLELFSDVDPNLLDCSFGETTSVTSELIWSLIESLTKLTYISASNSKSPSGTNAADLYDFLCSTTGLYLLAAIEILTRNQRNIKGRAGLTTVLITVLSKILTLSPNKLKLFLFQRDREIFFEGSSGTLHRPHTFEPICSFFSLPPTPPGFSFLLDLEEEPTRVDVGEVSRVQAGVTIGGAEGGGQSQREQRVRITSVFGSVCLKILCILEHLFWCPETLEEVVQNKHQLLDLLLELFSLDRQTTDCDLFILHKQLVRSLCRLLDTASRSRSHLLLLHEKVFS